MKKIGTNKQETITNKKSIKTKLLAIVMCLMLIVIPFAFTGCNYQMVDLEYTFTNAYVKIGDEWVDLKISKWADYEGEQLQLTLEDGTVVVVSSYNCILYNGKLPVVQEG